MSYDNSIAYFKISRTKIYFFHDFALFSISHYINQPFYCLAWGLFPMLHNKVSAVENSSRLDVKHIVKLLLSWYQKKNCLSKN